MKWNLLQKLCGSSIKTCHLRILSILKVGLDISKQCVHYWKAVAFRFAEDTDINDSAES